MRSIIQSKYRKFHPSRPGNGKPQHLGSLNTCPRLPGGKMLWPTERIQIYSNLFKTIRHCWSNLWVRQVREKCPGAWDWYCGRNICLLSSCLLPISYRQHVEYTLSLHLFCINDEMVVESSLPQCLMSWTSQLPDPALCWGAVLGVGGSSDSRILWGTLTRSYKDRTHHWDMGTLGLKHRNTTPGLREMLLLPASALVALLTLIDTIYTILRKSNWGNLR